MKQPLTTQQRKLIAVSIWTALIMLGSAIGYQVIKSPIRHTHWYELNTIYNEHLSPEQIDGTEPYILSLKVGFSNWRQVESWLDQFEKIAMEEGIIITAHRTGWPTLFVIHDMPIAELKQKKPILEDLINQTNHYVFNIHPAIEKQVKENW